MQAGAGFWLVDAATVRVQAEALAKAQFAAKRDPQDCALLYIALGRRTLLQVGLIWLLCCLPECSSGPCIQVPRTVAAGAHQASCFWSWPGSVQMHAHFLFFPLITNKSNTVPGHLAACVMPPLQVSD